VASICLRKNCHVLFGSWHHVQLWGRYQSEEYILIRWFILLLCDRYVIIFGSFWLSYKDTQRYLDLIAFDFILQFLRKLNQPLMNNIQTQSGWMPVFLVNGFYMVLLCFGSLEFGFFFNQKLQERLLLWYYLKTTIFTSSRVHTPTLQENTKGFRVWGLDCFM
jgi:hypothetical protein